ncbi:hypothetical protein C7534_118106 [Pseudomonas sp. OV226]|jgi:hypothetical protein|nr:hypothetical protein C7534_118106 [Pseudomonas sp. OV226]
MTFSSDTVEIIQQSQGGCCPRGHRAFASPSYDKLGDGSHTLYKGAAKQVVDARIESDTARYLRDAPFTHHPRH